MYISFLSYPYLFAYPNTNYTQWGSFLIKDTTGVYAVHLAFERRESYQRPCTVLRGKLVLKLV